jgi:hypothetical protein
MKIQKPVKIQSNPKYKEYGRYKHNTDREHTDHKEKKATKRTKVQSDKVNTYDNYIDHNVYGRIPLII